MSISALTQGNVALITGGASGIGLAVAKLCAARGMRVVLVDIREGLFAEAEAMLRAAGAEDVMCASVDVSDRAAVEGLRDAVLARFGRIDMLLSNAGIQPGSDIFDDTGTWAQVLGVNFGGVLNCCQSIVPAMSPGGLVINTGSKQGITTPPGDPAYNTSKAAVKVFTEALAHALREDGSTLSVHLLIPGFVFTDITKGDRTEKPAGAWSAEQCAAFMMERLAEGDFYILCPDNDVDRATDEKRMAWAAGDIINNRPPLSRWHKDHAEGFAAYMAGPQPEIP